MAVNIAQSFASPQLAAQDRQALKQVWEHIQPDSCPYSYNFHMHTLCSDGQLKPEEAIEQAIAIGLKGFAITDHHTTDGYQIAQSCLDERRKVLPADSLPHLWTGVEITANLLNTEVHILGYAFEPDHPSLQPYLLRKTLPKNEARADFVIAALHQAGGLVVLAHPARYRRSASELIPAAVDLGIDGVETYYAYNNPNPWHPSPRQTQQVKTFSTAYNLFNTCGTDTHGTSLLKRL